MLIIAVALAPLAIASIVQGVMHVQARQSATDNILHQTARYATRNEQNTFFTTRRFLELLSAQPEVRASRQACDRALALAAMGRVSALNVSLIGANGKTVCSSTGKADVSDYSRLAWWSAAKDHIQPFVVQQLHSAAAGRDVLPMILPLHDASGAFTGALSAALDMRWVAQVGPYGRLPPFAMMLIVDGNAGIVASSRAVPSGLGAEVARHGGDGRQHTFRSSDGTRWRWTGSPIPGSNKIIAFAISEPLPYLNAAYLLGDILLPVLMVILASIAMWLGTERLVIRWTNYLKRVSAAYKQNHYSLELTELEHAPEEFQLLGNEMKDMAASIRDRDRGLTAALEQKSAMTREIHHRIKNNLQIVSSVVSLYSQNVTDRPGKAAFAQIQARVSALTLIQRLMDMREADATVSMRELLTELSEQMRITAAEGNLLYKLTMNAENWLLPPDMATPVAFFAVEALSFDLFAPSTEGVVREVSLFFGGDGPERLILWIEDGAFTEDTLRAGRPAPERVFAALTEQVKGRYSLEKTPEGKARLILRLPIRADASLGAVYPPGHANAGAKISDSHPRASVQASS